MPGRVSAWIARVSHRAPRRAQRGRVTETPPPIPPIEPEPERSRALRITLRVGEAVAVLVLLLGLATFLVPRSDRARSASRASAPRRPVRSSRRSTRCGPADPLRAERSRASLTAMAALAHAPYRFTYDDVRAMMAAGVIDPDARYELLDGELLTMPSEGFPHVSLKTRIIHHFIAALSGSRWLAIPDSTLYLAANDAPEPDLYVVEEARFAFPVIADSISLVVEVADSSLAHDLKRKSRKYGAFGIVEYWVADVHGRETTVFTDPRPGGYGARRAVPFETALTPVRLPEAALRIADLPGWSPTYEVGGIR